VSWLEPPLVACGAVFAFLYALGARRRVRLLGRSPPYASWRAAAFVFSLCLVELVLSPPYDRIADESLAGHMLQHVVLMSFAPPLIVLAAPWLTIWRGAPLEVRRPVARSVMRLPSVVRTGFRGLIAPVPAFLLINLDLGIWHVPWLYDLTLHNGAVHYLEHATFVLFGTLFWIPVVESPPLRPRVGELQRVAYVTAGAAVGWLLALVLALAPSPLYPAYAALPHRFAGLSALGDQQLAAGLMLGIGSIPFTIAVFVMLYRWLDEGRAARAPTRRPPIRSAG
jgi:putative membrane protein